MRGPAGLSRCATSHRNGEGAVSRHDSRPGYQVSPSCTLFRAARLKPAAAPRWFLLWSVEPFVAGATNRLARPGTTAFGPRGAGTRAVREHRALRIVLSADPAARTHRRPVVHRPADGQTTRGPFSNCVSVQRINWARTPDVSRGTRALGGPWRAPVRQRTAQTSHPAAGAFRIVIFPTGERGERPRMRDLRIPGGWRHYRNGSIPHFCHRAAGCPRLRRAFGVARRGRTHRVQPGHPADSFRELLPVPRAGPGHAQGWLAVGHARRIFRWHGETRSDHRSREA